MIPVIGSTRAGAGFVRVHVARRGRRCRGARGEQPSPTGRRGMTASTRSCPPRGYLVAPESPPPSPTRPAVARGA